LGFVASRSASAAVGGRTRGGPAAIRGGPAERRTRGGPAAIPPFPIRAALDVQGVVRGPRQSHISRHR